MAAAKQPGDTLGHSKCRTAPVRFGLPSSSRMCTIQVGGALSAAALMMAGVVSQLWDFDGLYDKVLKYG